MFSPGLLRDALAGKRKMHEACLIAQILRHTNVVFAPLKLVFVFHLQARARRFAQKSAKSVTPSLNAPANFLSSPKSAAEEHTQTQASPASSHVSLKELSVAEWIHHDSTLFWNLFFFFAALVRFDEHISAAADISRLLC